MEKERCEASKQSSLEFRCKKIFPDAHKPISSAFSASHEVEVEKTDLFFFASPTPEKKIHPPRSMNKNNAVSENVNLSIAPTDHSDCEDNDITDENLKSSNVKSGTDLITETSLGATKQHSAGNSFKIPEKYNELVEFFDRIVCSVRLLQLRKRLPTFRDISTQVKVMTKRTLLYNHLAQIKYLLAELIQIEKILVHDQKSLCMVPELKITLSMDVIKQNSLQTQSSYMTLSQIFRARLLDFHNFHPEVPDVPEATLPEPFDLKTLSVSPEHSHARPAVATPACQSSPHNNERFSEKSFSSITESGQPFQIPSDAGDFNVEKNEFQYISGKDTSISAIAHIISPPDLTSIPDQSFVQNLDERTTTKPESSHTLLMTRTPTLPTPKKVSRVDSPDEKLVGNTKVPTHSARKSLLFSQSETNANASGLVICATEHISGQKRFIAEEEASHNHVDVTKMEIMEATSLKMDDMVVSKCQHTCVSLSELTNTIRFIFQSMSRCSITKQELIHKIISHNCDIEEMGEVEKMLKLLEESSPDWISKKTLSSGDTVYCI